MFSSASSSLFFFLQNFIQTFRFKFHPLFQRDNFSLRVLLTKRMESITLHENKAWKKEEMKYGNNVLVRVICRMSFLHDDLKFSDAYVPTLS